MKKLLVILLAAVLLWIDSTAAQQKPVLRIIIDPVDEDAIRCGITKSTIESIAALTLRNNGIQSTTADMNTFLGVTTNVLPTAAGGCAIDLKVKVSTFIPMPLTGGDGFKNRKFPTFATAVLCEAGGLQTVSQGQATTISQRNLESYIKLCLGQLDY